ncbi:MAG: GNAT family N-acetyltransferase, partial [Desulfobacteraceae bacterium]
PIFRKQGHGKHLLNHIVQWAQKNRYKHVFAVTAPKNTASQTLFQSMGFQTAETQWLDLEIKFE